METNAAETLIDIALRTVERESFVYVENILPKLIEMKAARKNPKKSCRNEISLIP